MDMVCNILVRFVCVKFSKTVMEERAIPLFDRDGHPVVPTSVFFERRAQALSRHGP
jgi:hypothetical protein